MFWAQVPHSACVRPHHRCEVGWHSNFERPVVHQVAWVRAVHCSREQATVVTSQMYYIVTIQDKDILRFEGNPVICQEW